MSHNQQSYNTTSEKAKIQYDFSICAIFKDLLREENCFKTLSMNKMNKDTNFTEVANGMKKTKLCR